MEIKKVLKKYMKIEIFIGSTTNGLEKVMGKWSSIYNDLMNVLIQPNVKQPAIITAF